MSFDVSPLTLNSGFSGIEIESREGLAALPEGIWVTAEALEGRRRRVSAGIQLPYTAAQLWSILTDYDHLADFIPNLAESQRIKHPAGGIRVEQTGAQSFWKFKVKFCARVVLDMVETFPSELRFEMVEGDFKEFFGSWTLQPVGAGLGTHLVYTLTVWPHRMMPLNLIESRLKHDLAVNLDAIRRQAELRY